MFVHFWLTSFTKKIKTFSLNQFHVRLFEGRHDVTLHIQSMVGILKKNLLISNNHAKQFFAFIFLLLNQTNFTQLMLSIMISCFHRNID